MFGRTRALVQVITKARQRWMSCAAGGIHQHRKVLSHF